MTKYTCEEQFEDTPNNNSNNRNPRPIVSEFALTLLVESGLSRRLVAEIRFVAQRFKLSWPRFKEDPVRFIKSGLVTFASAVMRRIFQPQMSVGLATSVVLLGSLLLMISVLQSRSPRRLPEESDQFDLVTTINLSANANDSSGSGVGAGNRGRVGFARGRGEGSRPLPARAQGGGGGGMGAYLSPSKGRPPAPSLIPAPIPTAAIRLPQALPVAGIDLDPALWRKLDYSSYGDPRSKSTTPSNGPGDGGGIGTGQGTGIGEGDGSGFGPGKDGNMGGDRNKPGGGGIGGSRGNNPNDDGDHVYKPPEVSTRPRVIAKPEPQYTEEARRNQITGTVVLRVVFSSSGQVTNIQTVQKLSNGLTEKAIAAARQIRFMPATRDGRPVSMYMQLEYNFNLY